MSDLTTLQDKRETVARLLLIAEDFQRAASDLNEQVMWTRAIRCLASDMAELTEKVARLLEQRDAS